MIENSSPPSEKARPFGFFAGPVVWGLQVLAGYGLATIAGRSGSALGYYLLCAVVVVIVLAAGFTALASWRRSKQREKSYAESMDSPDSRATFVAASSFYMSALFFLLTLLTGVFALFLSARPFNTTPFP
jgi:hypothetical protein